MSITITIKMACICDLCLFILLRGRPGRITRLAHPYVRLSVCPPVPYDLYELKTWKQKRTKINVLRGTSKWSANFQFNRSRSPDVKNLKKLPHI